MGYFPELLEYIKDKSQVFISEPFWVKPIILFTKTGYQKINSVDDLEGKKIALIQGYSYGKEVNAVKGVERFYVPDDYSSLKMLSRRRVDAVLGDLHSTVHALKEMALEEQIQYRPKKPIALLDVFFVFQETPEGELINKKISRVILEMKREGILDINRSLALVDSVL